MLFLTKNFCSPPPLHPQTLPYSVDLAERARGGCRVRRGGDGAAQTAGRARRLRGGGRAAGTNCVKIGLPGKLILGKRKDLLEVLGAIQ